MSTRSICGVFLLAGVVSMLCVDVALAQRGGGRGMMRMMGGNSQFALLNDKNVQSELELVDDQIAELEEIQEEAMQVMRDMFSEMQDLPREQMQEGFRNMREKLQERMKPFEGRVKDVLLPHQHDRLKQLGFQNSGRGQGNFGALGNEDLLDELDVTDEQRKELEEAAAKAREKLQEQYAKLVREAEEDILKVLDSDQRKKYRELVGKPFQFEDRTAGRGFGRGNDRGSGTNDRGFGDRVRDRRN